MNLTVYECLGSMSCLNPRQGQRIYSFLSQGRDLENEDEILYYEILNSIANLYAEELLHLENLINTAQQPLDYFVLRRMGML